ncbi:MAG TPA: LamG domain-containing protein [Planctomycetota bacterium]|nr:LamG domain-containing protein [Planctomycetota bacterium]
MGHAILYCSGCSTQLREPDFEKGAAFRSDGRVYCKDCAPEDVRAKAPVPERKPELISPGTSRIMYAVPPPAAGKTLPTPVLIAGGIGLLVLLLAAGLMLGSGSSRPPSHEPPARELVRPPETRPDPPPPPPPLRPPEPPPAPKDERPAEDALRKARDFAQSRPEDLAGQLAFFDAAVVAADGTGHSVTAVRERDAVLTRLKPEVKSGLDALDAAAKAATAKDDYGKGLKLFEDALAKPLGPEWTAEVQRRSQKYSELAQNAFTSVKNSAVGARQRGDEVTVKRITDRVDKWGIERYRSELASILAVTKVKPPPPPAPPKGLDAYRKRWSEVVATAPTRDFAALLKKLEEPKVTDPALQPEAAADLELLKQAMAAEDEGRQALAKSPKGQKLTLTFNGESGALVEVSGTVTRIDAQLIVLARDKGPVHVPAGEVAARSLAALAKRPDGKGAAVLCLLEKDVEGAKTFVEGDGGIPEKYWSLVKLAKDPAEAEARKQFWSAERDLSNPAKAVGAAQRMAALLKERSETAFVRRNRALIAALSDPVREFFFALDDLRLRGSFRSARTDKDEPYWKTLSEVDPVKNPENAAEITFSVVPDTEYRCWFYVGGCCTETVTCSFQIGDAADAPGDATPVRQLPSMQYKTHASHTGRGRPVPRFGWVSIPLPKFTTPGAKKVRLTSAEKGFCVVQALVSATRPGAPTNADLKELERTRLETRGRTDPSLVGHWKLSDGAGDVAVDSSPMGNDGKLMNGAAWAPGKETPWSPPSLKLDGNAHVSLGTQVQTLQNVSAWTMAAWICPEKLSAEQNVILAFSKNNGTTPTQDSRAQICLLGSGFLYGGGRAADAAKDPQGVKTAEKVAKPGVWIHVAAVMDYSSEVVLYVNGETAAQAAVKFNQKATPNSPSTCASLGGDDDGSRWFFNGRLSDVRVYNRALTKEEVAELAATR